MKCQVSRTSRGLLKDWYLENLPDYKREDLINSLIGDLERCGLDRELNKIQSQYGVEGRRQRDLVSRQKAGEAIKSALQDERTLKLFGGTRG